METRGPELHYYIIYGPEPAKILATYTQLTGRMPLPPKWALGYHQCRWSYESEDIVRQKVFDDITLVVFKRSEERSLAVDRAGVS